MTKKLSLGLVFLLLLLSLVTLTYSAEPVGCCTNPLANDFHCTFEQVEQTVCCPNPTFSPSFYYDADLHPYGPDNEQECISNYFNEGSDCSTFTQQCQTTCCCGNGDPYETEKGICVAQGGTPYEGADCNAQACGGVITPPINANCQDPGYIPQISQVDITPTKGEKELNLLWSDTCQANSYKITRCQGEDCVVVGQPTNKNFTDSAADLLWDTTYTYKIEGIYPIQNLVEQTITYSTSLGNLECWGRDTRDKFCLHLNNYKQSNIKQYVIQQNDDITEGNFDEATSQLYSDKLNSAYRCDRFNELTDPPFQVCSEEEICVVEDDEAQCVQESLCEPNFLESPFGLFTSQDQCHNLGFCYSDTSNTLVDKCYSCSAGMSCYDYKSQGACESNQCGVGTGNCVWRDLISEAGVGVCIDDNDNNCEWCDDAGTQGTDTTGFNSVLASCTQEKTQALSTAEHQCYFVDGRAESCSTVSCNSISLNDCPIIEPRLANDNSILTSLGACDIGVCQQFGNICRKNANEDGQADCANAEDEEACELDHFPPTTYFTPIDEDGITIGFDISITDKIAGTTLYNPQNYKTFLCIEAQGSSACANRKGTTYGLFTTDTKLSINGLRLSDWNSDRGITDLNEGLNTLYYFTEDESGNVGIVQTIQVEAHADNSRPELFRIEIENGRLIDEIFYTNRANPEIKLFFREPGAEILPGTKIRDRSNVDIITFDQFTIIPPPRENTTNYTLQPPTDNSFLEGEYTFSITAKNANNVPLALSQRQHTIRINYTLSNATITPPPPDFTENSLIDLSISFPQPVNLDWLTISGIDYLTEFPQDEDDFTTLFTKKFNLSDGTKRISVGGKDIFGNDATGYAEFVINSHPPEFIDIISPSNGVSSTHTFDLIVQSENDLECRYSIDDEPNINEFDFMNVFDETNSDTHTKRDITINDENTHKLYIFCKDEYFRPEPYRFETDLRVDTSPPTITDLHTLPKSPVAELPVNLTLTAVANEPVQCKYSEQNEPFDSMDQPFEDFFENDFKNRKRAYIFLTEQDTYTYYVACENEAELVSETRSVSFSVDLSIPLQITDRTEEYQGTASPRLAIETNKRAACRYSFTDSNVLTGQVLGLSTQDSYSHTATLSVNVSSASYEVFVRCFRQGEFKLATSQFTIDLTAPVMQYVNDTSLERFRPEITPYQDKIYVTWKATDNETGDLGLRYNYSLVESISKEPVINWTSGDNLNYDNNVFEDWITKDHKGDDLNLSDDTKYQFVVASGNIVGHWSEELESDGVTTDFSLQSNSTCSNGIKDSDETDVDCGGVCGPTCREGETCDKHRDCRDNYCSEDNVCEEPSCKDDIENGDETDVDCGGNDCDKCSEGDSCNVDSDCDTGNCRFNTCKPQDSCSDGVLSAGESDVDCGGVCPSSCGEGKYCDISADCSSGLECSAGVCTLPDAPQEVDNDGDGIPDAWEIRNGLDPDDPSDADLDFDGDELTNYNEYLYGTDPSNPDTDGDGHTDKEEVDKGTDPTDPNDKPGGLLKTILLILGILIILGALGYLVYTQYYQKKNTPPPMTQQRRMPQQPFMRKPMMARQVMKRKPVQKKKRTSLLSSFGTKEEIQEEKERIKTEESKELKETLKEEQKEDYINLANLKKKQPKDEVFKKLSSIVNQKEKTEKSTSPPKKDSKALDNLTKLSKKTSKEMNKDLKKHSDELDTKIDTIEKKVIEMNKPQKVYATKTGKKYHNVDCITLKNISTNSLRPFKNKSDAEKAKLKPCNVCIPKKK